MRPSPLHTLLQTELSELGAFVALLQAEQDALVQNKLAELVDFAKQKHARAQTLGTLAHDRARLFEANGVDISPQPPHDLSAARKLPDDALPSLAALWRQLLQEARHASALNQTNGRLIETRHQQNQQLMQLLQASGADGALMSYDAYGQPKLSRRGGSLGKV